MGSSQWGSHGGKRDSSYGQQECEVAVPRHNQSQKAERRMPVLCFLFITQGMASLIELKSLRCLPHTNSWCVSGQGDNEEPPQHPARMCSRQWANTNDWLPLTSRGSASHSHPACVPQPSLAYVLDTTMLVFTVWHSLSHPLPDLIYNTSKILAPAPQDTKTKTKTQADQGFYLLFFSSISIHSVVSILQ